MIKFLGEKVWIFGDDYIYVLDAICMGLTQNEKKGYIKTLFNAIEFLGEDKRELTDSIYNIIRYYDERYKDKPNIICKGDRYHICSNQLDDIEERYFENWADLVFVVKYRINEYDSDMRFLSPYMIMHLSNMKKHDKGGYISLCKK